MFKATFRGITVDVQGVVVGHIGLRRERRSLRKVLEGEKGA